MTSGGAATQLGPSIERLLGTPLPLRVEFWDGSSIGPADAAVTVVVRTNEALRRLLWAPGELGLARAYVTGDLDVRGDFRALLAIVDEIDPARLRFGLAALAPAVRLAGSLRPLAPPPEEARPRGRTHSRRRDAAAISHHYDVGNDFYRLVLGDRMTYSCARFLDDDTTLDEAQDAKHELICRKLGLHERPGQRLLDVGCGWGSMVIHAARHHGARCVGVTISEQQAIRARERVAAAGVDDRVEIRLQDYRDLDGEDFDGISSIGMFEHVGAERVAEYFTTLRQLLRPEGRLLNHAISKPGGSRLRRRSFIGRYVFPDGELLDVGDTILAMEAAGFEVRDVESLREHYARTLDGWVANLERRWDEAVELVGERRARVWRLYMAGSARSFARNRIAVHQVLGVATPSNGHSGMPATRAAWERDVIAALGDRAVV